MKSVCEIIDALGGPAEFGRICGFSKNPASRGSDMRQRGSIPVAYWPRIAETAKSAGVKGITYEALVEAHAGSKPVPDATLPQVVSAHA